MARLQAETPTVQKMGPIALPFIAALCFTLTSPASAQSSSEPTDYELLKGIVDQLEHPLYAKREEASDSLSELVDHNNVNALYVFLEDSRLSSEQRYRILQVFGDKVVNRPSGALGIRMNPGVRGMDQAVEITALLPGMPAEKVLKIDDRIRRIDNTKIQNSNDLRWYVQTKQPGDRVLITVDRPKSDEKGLRVFDDQNRIVYESKMIELELGSVEQLDANSDSRTNVQGIRQNRQRLAQEAYDQYAPQAIEIIIRNKEDLYNAIVDAASANPEVDDHPLVQLMLNDADRIVNGRVRISVEDRKRWDSYLKQISIEYNRPENRNHRTYLYDVIQRLLKLRSQLLGVPNSGAFPGTTPSNNRRNRRNRP